VHSLRRPNLKSFFRFEHPCLQSLPPRRSQGKNDALRVRHVDFSVKLISGGQGGARQKRDRAAEQLMTE
jgi:hypothetical protein